MPNWSKVTLCDTYGQTGYLGMGVSNLVLEKTLQRLIGPGVSRS